MTPEPPGARPPLLLLALVLVLATALAGAVVAWRGTDAESDGDRFSDCVFEDGKLTLSWLQGPGDTVHTSVTPGPEEIVVSLDLDSPDGSGEKPDLGNTRVQVGGAYRPVRHADGTELPCKNPINVPTGHLSRYR